MTVLLNAADIDGRRAAATGTLHALADSLALDLEPLLGRELFIPPEKARMTRRGGRCERDGTMLEFDPWSPRAHRCPRCGAVFDDDTHYRWWIMGYQLWLAERAVHAATLFALRRNARHGELARSVLGAYADRYLEYPNRDNVLGPTRVFFSTYLESIWLLQLVVALDLLETAGGTTSPTLGAEVRDRLVEPSAALIASYDEGLSNRQVWNNAALLAASRVLSGRVDETAVSGPSGLVRHLEEGLLGDGTWYEGENYHLFAHRGLWYGVTIAGAAGVRLDAGLVARFEEAFATPFVTALPDFTFPSRRDSQYRVSLRQWRFAELAELGFVRRPGDRRLTGALSTLYDGTVPRGDTGRSRSPAEAERNSPAVGLDRADLGWRSLLFASPTLPPLAPSRPRSALLAEQGYAILRREDGALYAALDYGHSGAGHGHPDRLNLVLVHGRARWLDDVGTGSYVDPSLHWYRSTLAHNAPLVDGRSQERVHGALIAYEDQGDAGWVRARVDGVAPGVTFDRTLVAMTNYVLDELSWNSDRDVQVDLPFHADGELVGVGLWERANPNGSSGLEDGFRFLSNTETTTASGAVRLRARIDSATADARFIVDGANTWWRATAFGPPGSVPARFHFLRMNGRSGKVVSVWDVQGAIESIAGQEGSVIVHLGDGSRHDHRPGDRSWHVSIVTAVGTTTVDLGGARERARAIEARPGAARAPLVIPRLHAAPGSVGRLMLHLSESNYRRSESAWSDAGAPRATVSLWADGDELFAVVDVEKRDVHFAPQIDSNPLDNEHPDTNSDGVQLHLIVASAVEGGARHELNWLLVPERDGNRVRVSARAVVGVAPPLRASWERTSHGYSVRIVVDFSALGAGVTKSLKLGIVVNEMTSDRERRRGQLVLGGRPGQFVYLRGDRVAAEELLDFRIADD